MTTTTKRPYEDQNIWNIIFSLFFIGVFLAALGLLVGKWGAFPKSIPLFDAILLPLAAFRITRLVVYDKITRWFRELFMAKKIVVENGEKMVELRPFASGFRRTIHDLLGCPWCIGFWSALFVVFGYFLFSWAWVVILFLAVAGMGSLVQLIANAIGWRAENLKMDALSREQD